MLEMLLEQYNMDTMKPNQVCVSGVSGLIFPFHTKHLSIHQAAFTFKRTFENLKVKQTLMQVVPLPASLPPSLLHPSIPPSRQAGDTPLHLAASNGHLDTIHLLLLHFDTRDEANAVGKTSPSTVCVQRLIHCSIVAASPVFVWLLLCQANVFWPESDL